MKLVLESEMLFQIRLCNFGEKKGTFIIHKNMSRKIKLIWDFRGPASAKTAEHHEIHLKEYIAIEKLIINITGFEIINEMYAIAFMVVTDENMIAVRNTLKPHRGEVYEG